MECVLCPRVQRCFEPGPARLWAITTGRRRVGRSSPPPTVAVPPQIGCRRRLHVRRGRGSLLFESARSSSNGCIDSVRAACRADSLTLSGTSIKPASAPALPDDDRKLLHTHAGTCAHPPPCVCSMPISAQRPAVAEMLGAFSSHRVVEPGMADELPVAEECFRNAIDVGFGNGTHLV